MGDPFCAAHTSRLTCAVSQSSRQRVRSTTRHHRIEKNGYQMPWLLSRTNSKEMKELLDYMARHHEDLDKTFTEEQKEIFDKFHDCWSEYMSLAEAAIFEYAFKLGMQIAIETLTE